MFWYNWDINEFFYSFSNKLFVKLPDNARVGYYFDAYVGDNGELLVVDGNNTVFSASMNDNGTLSDYDGATWFDID